jgi:hypothetical protein
VNLTRTAQIVSDTTIRHKRCGGFSDYHGPWTAQQRQVTWWKSFAAADVPRIDGRAKRLKI